MRINSYGSIIVLEYDVPRVNYLGEDVMLPRAYREIVPCVKVDDSWQDVDVSSETQEVQDFCTAQWTEAVKQAYKDHVDANLVIEE